MIDVKKLFEDEGALLSGHFLLSSGLHSPNYMQSALVLANPKKAAMLADELARRLPAPVDLIVSPAMGGLIIGHEVARALGLRAYFAERENGIMTLRRGFKIRAGERVAVVEDVITTGRSTREVFDLLRTHGADVAAALSIIDRSEKPLDLGVPYASLAKLTIPSFPAENCPLCREGTPAVKPGSRTQPK